MICRRPKASHARCEGSADIAKADDSHRMPSDAAHRLHVLNGQFAVVATRPL